MTQFLEGFSKIVNQHAPLRPLTKKEIKLNAKPWLSNGILKSIQTKNALFKKCYKKNDPVLIENYEKYSNKLTSIKRIAKQNYYAHMIQLNKNDLSKQWRLINQILERKNKHKASITKLINEKNESLTSNVEISNNLNSYFINIGPKMASKIPETETPNTISSSPNSFFCEPCTEGEVFREMMHLNGKKSVGIENIPIKFIKMSAEYTSSVLADRYNKCMQEGVFPSKLKIAKVTPIFKNGCRYTASNYRPISVLSPFSKIFEKIIYNRLNSYFSNHNILTNEQFGFRVKHSTSHVICDVINKLHNSCDNKKFTCLILLDLSKAFDTVNHKILLSKLEKYGVRGNSLKLINDYLTNRKQVVHVNNTYSDQQSIVCGVPQGSTLGPLLFSVYINDLSNASKFQTRLYADDTVLFLSNDDLKTLNKNVNYELLNIEAWLNANKLSLNYSKTKYLLIKPKTKTSQLCKFAVTIKGIELEKCQSAKYLGIILDENMNWEPHIQFLGKKLSQAVGIIAKMRHYLNQKNLINLYYVFFYSQILYGILGWGCASQTRKRPIQILQNKVLRIINKTSWKDKIINNTLFYKYKFLKIDDIYNYEVGNVQNNNLIFYSL